MEVDQSCGTPEQHITKSAALHNDSPKHPPLSIFSLLIIEDVNANQWSPT